jgi:plastocyanin
MGLVMAGIPAAIAFLSGPETQAAEGRRIVIEIRDLAFAPDAPKLKPGDVVVWINKDIVPHTVTAADDSWDSGQIDSGGRWEMVMKEGQFKRYYCQFHPSMTTRLHIVTG